MSERKPVKTWTRTNIGNLIKHRSGRYYSRLFVGGKQRWRSLGTKVLEVAKAKLREEQRAQGKIVPIVTHARSGRMTMDAAITVLRNEIEAKLAMPRSKKKRMITDTTGHYRAQTIEALCKTWTEIVGSNLAAMEVRKVIGS